MPNRIIKESIKSSDQIDQLTWFEEVVYYRLIVSADDYGCFDGRPVYLKNELFPTKDTVTKKAIEDAIQRLASVGLLHKYEVNGKPYLFFPTWEKHQRIRNKHRKYPLPPVDGHLTADCGQMTADCQPESESNPNPNPNPESKSNSTRAHEAADPGLAKVMTLYMDRVQSLPSPSCVDLLKGYTAELSADVVCHAIESALDDNKRQWSYIQGILRRYSAEGLTSLEAVQASEAEFARAKERSTQCGQRHRAKDRMGFLAESIRRDLENDRAGREGDNLPFGDAVGQLQGSGDGS